MKPVYSEIEINAPAELVWQAILDTDNYPQWNSFIPRVSLNTGKFSVGTEFNLDCAMTPKQLLKNEKEVVLEISPGTFTFRMGTSRQYGRPGIKSNRCQICEPIDSNRTRYINYEEFSGFLSPMVYWLYRKKMDRAFAKHNEDLKTYVENMFSQQSNA